MKDVFEWRTNRLGIGKPQSKATLEVHA
jgi:hypothetical protein